MLSILALILFSSTFTTSVHNLNTGITQLFFIQNNYALLHSETSVTNWRFMKMALQNVEN